MIGAAFLHRLRRDESGLAAEFALVVPLMLLLILGTIDIGIYAYTLNRAEKATQIGARWAAVTDPLNTELKTVNLSGVTVSGTQLGQGDRVPAAALGLLTCNNTTCTCTTGPCYGTGHDAAAFTKLADRMRQILPGIQNSNIVVEYRGSGLGYAGDPNGPDIAPLITVRLTGLSYNSIVLSPLGTTTSLPDFAYSITSEDGSGTASY